MRRKICLMSAFYAEVALLKHDEILLFHKVSKAKLP